MRDAVARVWAGEAELSYGQGALLLVGSGFVFSFTALLFRGLDGATDWQFLTVRGLGMALAMVTVVWLRRRTRPINLAAAGWATVVAGVLMAAMSTLYVLALARTTAAMTTAFLAAGPFSGALFGWVLLRERVRSRTWIALGLATVGIAVIVSGGLDAGSAAGVLLAAAIPVLLGLYNVLVRSTPEVDPVVPALIGGAMLALVAGTVAASASGLSMSMRDLALGATAGFVILGLGLPMFNLGHRSVPTAQVSLLIMTEIVLTPLWVWIWPGETPSISTLIGGAVIITAVVWQVTGAERVALRHPVV
ncbi:MAG TPA: DMT family transporter [Acidimicrobiia bacterium]|nr:DMT family transporter [Acidimicrobiia bacterium]